MKSPMTKLGLVLANAGEAEIDMPLPGVYPGVPMRTYHRWAGASNSRLSKLRQSPAHLKAYMDEPTPDAAHFKIGRAVHTAILEPERFDSTYIVSSQCTATKKGDGKRCENQGIIYAGGEWFCGVHGRGIGSFAGERTVLPGPDHRAALAMRDAVYAHPRARRLLTGKGEVELSATWNDVARTERGEAERADVLCKCRPDRASMLIAGGALVDVKSTMDASPYAFERAIYNYGYHRQGAHYLNGARACGLQVQHFVIIAVEKVPPFAVAVYRVSDAAIDAGDQQLRPLIARYGECVATNEWPGYSTDILDTTLPSYAWSQIEQETKEVTV